MKLLRLLPILLCFLFALSPTAAQEAADTGWPIEERCLAEPTPPPDDWTFPGAILMTGYAGIHGVNADWETPHVLTFINSDDFGSGSLSPDKNWLSAFANHWQVLSTKEPYVFYEIDNSALPQRGSPVIWLDDETLLYKVKGEDSVVLVQPFTASVQLDSTIRWLDDPSPDRTRNMGVDTAVMTADTMWTMYDAQDQTLLNRIGKYLHPAQRVIWMPDSSGFMAITQFQESNENHNWLTLHNQDGMIVDSIVNLSPHFLSNDIVFSYPKSGLDSLEQPAAWSPDQRYFAFTTHEKPLIRIVDMQERRVMDTCVGRNHSIAWSPDSTKLAFTLDEQEQRAVMVLDLDDWALHTVAYHDGSVIGWRGD